MTRVNIWSDGEIIEVEAEELYLPDEDPISVSGNTFTYKSDLFDRCQDDAEAETILNGVAAMGAKLNAFFHAVDTIRHDHALFPQLQAGFVQAFGQARADELLAPSI